jgi:predicted class III extradiol MEMO1 family dioxygenase
MRPPAIAGTFYSAEPDALTGMIDACMAGARDNGLSPKAGLPQDFWDDSIRLWRYTTEAFH